MLMISHGYITHSFKEKKNCLDCVETDKEFKQAIKKAGGKKKFLEKLKKGEI